MKVLNTIKKSGMMLTVVVGGLLMTVSCGGKQPYKIDGTVEGLGTQNLTIIYHGGTPLREMTINAVNSAFHIE